MRRKGFGFIALAAWIGFSLAGNLIAQSSTAPGSPPALPTAVHPPPPTVPAPVPPPPAVVTQSLDALVVWDSEAKESTVTNGTPEAHFSFKLTNISSNEIQISKATGSCGCTVAKLPAYPWIIAPGAGGEISVTMNLAGKSGTIPKVVTVESDKGIKALRVTTIIQPPAAATSNTMGDRENNLKLAAQDRQAVFRGDCARCHTEPTRDKTGLALYETACGICHESDHRASMVPNLRALPHETNAEFWKTWILHGKPGTLMPAFAQAEGGILTDAQILSLVGYLTTAIPSHPVGLQPKPPAGVDKIN